MIKVRNRKLSMLLVLAMLMTMFVGVGTASAANATYSVPSTPSIMEGDGQTLGTIFITIDEASMLGTGQWLLVGLPSGVSFTEDARDNGIEITAVNGAVYNSGNDDVALKAVSGPINIDHTKSRISSDRSLEIFVTPTGNGEAIFSIAIDADVENVSDAINVTLAGPTGTFFPRSIVTVANVAGKAGDASVMISSVKSISEGKEQEIDIITIEEKTAKTFKNGTVVKLELPRGFSWSSKNVNVKGGWGIAGFDTDENKLPATTGLDSSEFVKVTTDRDKRDLIITFDSAYETMRGLIQAGAGIDSNTPGRIALGNFVGKELMIDVDDSAKLGDVEVKITVKHGSSTALNTNLVVAKYADFDVQVVEDEVKEVFAGQFDVELGTFVIEEGVAGSILSNRTIILDLPSGVKWMLEKDKETYVEADKNDLWKVPTIDVKKGTASLLEGQQITHITSSKGKSIRLTTGNVSANAVRAVVEDLRVKIDPDFEGDLEITVRGTAGVEGTVKVAEVVKPVNLEAKGAANVVIGQANQKAANIIITENDVEAIMDDANNNEIILELDNGVRFSSKPTVKVTEGDLEIDSTKLTWNDNALQIKVKYASSKEASTIEISDVNLTVDRTVPVGAIKAHIVDAERCDSALDETGSDKSPGNVVIANVVTPAASGGVGEFKINSNIYYVNGSAKVMDVAPYIKDSRTYVPMRYVAEMLGAEVVWDDAARTVTLTKGDDVAVFTIGSTTYTVNGEAMTADVAPEITNDRTMLPARFVAEAFGAVVGWDAVTQTVVISQ